MCNATYRVETRISSTSFDTAHVRPVKASSLGELLLRHLQGFTELSHAGSEGRAKVAHRSVWSATTTRPDIDDRLYLSRLQICPGRPVTYRSLAMVLMDLRPVADRLPARVRAPFYWLIAILTFIVMAGLPGHGEWFVIAWLAWLSGKGIARLVRRLHDPYGRRRRSTDPACDRKDRPWDAR